MSFGGGRRLSLVEQKKLQWAKEREEMMGLCGLWGPVMSASKTSDHIGVGVYGGKADIDARFGLAGQYRSSVGKQEEDYGCPAQRFEGGQCKRSSSLPPIGSRGWSKQVTETCFPCIPLKAASLCYFHPKKWECGHVVKQSGLSSAQQTEEECVERDDSVATSGYNSDSAGTSEPGTGCRADGGGADRGHREWPPEQEVDTEEGCGGSAGCAARRHAHRLSRHAGWKQKEGSRWESEENMDVLDASESNADAMESASRARWGDHGVGVGHLWEPAPVSSSAPRLPPVVGRAETPAWLSRGLDRLDRLHLGDRSGADILVLPSRDLSTPSMSEPSVNDSIADSFGRSFLRGQNIPVEADILAERQKRREKAISHQNAIRQQVEERDRQRREERELKMKMDLVEEERLKQEQERIRLQEQLERRRIAEKQEMEEKRLAAMAEALHIAREHAKDEHSRLRRRHLQHASMEEVTPPAQVGAEARNEPLPTVSRTPSEDILKPPDDNRNDSGDSAVFTSKKAEKVEEAPEENGKEPPCMSNVLKEACDPPSSQGTVPQGTIPQGTVPQGPVPQGPVPQGPVPQGRVPQGPVPQGPVPQGTASQGAVSREVAFQGALSQGAVSQGEAFQEAAFQDAVSQGAASQEATFKRAVSQGVVSQGVVSQGAISQGAISEGAVPQGTDKAQSWMPVVEMYSPDGLACRSLSSGSGSGHPAMLLPPGLAHQSVSPLCLVSADGSYAALPSAFPLQLPLPFIPMAQNSLPLALVIPTLQENTQSVRRREVGTQTSAGRRRSGWDGSGNGDNLIAKHRCDRSTLTERPQWGVNRSGAKYIKQSDKDLSFRQRCHRSQRRRLVAPTIANGNNACARNRWWSTVQLSEDELSKTYLISSNPVSSGSSSSGSGTVKMRNDDAADGEDERDARGDYECVDEFEISPRNGTMNNAVPFDLFSQLSALKIVR